MSLMAVKISFAWQCAGPAGTNCLQCHAAIGGGTAGSNPYPDGFLHTQHGSLDCTFCHCEEPGTSSCTPSSQPVNTHCCIACHDACLKIEEHTAGLRYDCASCHYLFDSDTDGLADCLDNCPQTPNAGQEDTYPPGGNKIGDACDCESDFNCDSNVDAGDVTSFLSDFGRSPFFNPCTDADPCNGDFDCNVNVDAGDVNKFFEDFGRSQFNNPCPVCISGNWCSYSGGDGLVSNCFNWPDQDFTPTNSAPLTVALHEGEPAVGFTLMDTSGVSYTLSSLLTTKPVLLVFGAFT